MTYRPDAVTPLCRPDTACGPGRCGKPARYAVDHWPVYGATWGRHETLHLCQRHAVELAWHYGLLRCLACGETEVRWPATHHCEEGGHADTATEEAAAGAAPAGAADRAGAGCGVAAAAEVDVVRTA